MTQSWKRQEREIAAMFGSHRNPNTGEHRLDIEAGPWGIEVKKRKRLPTLLKAAMKQAENACSDAQTPLVVLCEVKPRVKAERYAVMRLSDFVAWYGEGK